MPFPNNIINLTPLYHATSNSSTYEKSFPEFFAHYNTYWSSPEQAYVSISKSETEKITTALTETFRNYLQLCADNGISDTEKVAAILFVGKNTTDGHAFQHNNCTYSFYPIEKYARALYRKVFVMHELIHALHYDANPEFSFSNLKEKNLFARNLITEGLATYLTKEFLQLSEADALWADFLQPTQQSEWMDFAEDISGSLRNTVYSISILSMQRTVYSTIRKNCCLFTTEQGTGWGCSWFNS